MSRLITDPMVLPDDLKRSGDVRWPRREEIWHAVQVTVNPNYTIPAGAAAVIPWNSEDYDTSNMHDSVTNNTRLTSPTDGIYYVFVSVRLSGVTNLLMQIRVNGSTVVHSYRRDGVVSSDTNHTFCCIVHLTKGEYIELLVDFDDATDRVLFNIIFSKFGMYRVA